MVYEVTSKGDFDSRVAEAGNKLVVIDFYATWCGPCKRIAPHLEALSKENPQVVFLKVDVDKCKDITKAFNITSMPTFVFLKNGQKITQFSGANVDKLNSTISANK